LKNTIGRLANFIDLLLFTGKEAVLVTK